MHRDEVRHVLRTPLTVVKGVLRLLENPSGPQLPPEIRAELITRANVQLRHLERALETVEAHFSDSPEKDVIVLYEEPMTATPLEL